MRPEPSSAAKTVAELGEFELIRRITQGRKSPAGTVLGPGDDAAVLRAPDGHVVATTDVLVQNVHFRLDWSTPDQVGRKAVAVNLADLAAMGAVPTGLLVALACPANTPVQVVEELANGMWAEATRAGTGLVGGDIVTADQLLISVTALGDLGGRAPLTRSGARVGDVVAACGRLGWAAAGLAVLGRGFRSPVGVVGAYRIPEPPYEAGPQAAVAGATAMIDTSDGLIADLGHIAKASGVGVDLRIERLRVDQRLVDVGSALGVDPMRWVLTGGEDHALVATFPEPQSVPDGWRTLGSVVPGHDVTVNGEPYEGGGGWEHFR